MSLLSIFTHGPKHYWGPEGFPPSPFVTTDESGRLIIRHGGDGEGMVPLDSPEGVETMFAWARKLDGYALSTEMEEMAKRHGISCEGVTFRAAESDDWIMAPTGSRMVYGMTDEQAADWLDRLDRSDN